MKLSKSTHTLDSIRFCRKDNAHNEWALLGVPASLFPTISNRLFFQGATLIASGCSIRQQNLWIVFQAPPHLPSLLASIFPAPQGLSPLFFSRSGKLLQGAVLSSILTKTYAQRVEAGIICQASSPGEAALATCKD